MNSDVRNRSARLMFEALLVEAALIVLAVGLYNYVFLSLGLEVVGLAAVILLAAVPSPLYLGMRLPVRPGKRVWSTHLATGIGAGVIAAGTLVLAGFAIGAATCPETFSMSECRGPADTSLILGAIVMLGFVTLTPVPGLLLSREALG